MQRPLAEVIEMAIRIHEKSAYVRSVLLAILLSGAGAGCVAGSDADGGWSLPMAEDDIVTNGVRLNGVRLNGVRLNGVRLNGTEANGNGVSGVLVSGVLSDGAIVNDIHADGTTLVGHRADDGTEVAGQDFTGATLTAIQTNGAQAALRVSAFEPGSGAGLDAYVIQRRHGAGWISACGDDDGGPVPAYPLMGRWDYSQGTSTGGDHVDDPTMFTLACKESALAECIDIGYRPWESVEACTSEGCQDVPLRAYHQACTRMLRADYCGDGTPHTITGIPINIWDDLGIQSPAAVDWPLEAEWGTGGAICVKHTRWISGSPGGPLSSLAYVLHHCPERVSAQALSACGTPASTFGAGASAGAPLDARSLFRNASCVPSSASGWATCADEAAGD